MEHGEQMTKIERPLEDGSCDKCQWCIEGRYCGALVFLGRAQECFFVSDCMKFKESDGE